MDNPAYEMVRRDLDLEATARQGLLLFNHKSELTPEQNERLNKITQSIGEYVLSKYGEIG